MRRMLLSERFTLSFLSVWRRRVRYWGWRGHGTRACVMEGMNGNAGNMKYMYKVSVMLARRDMEGWSEALA